MLLFLSQKENQGTIMLNKDLSAEHHLSSSLIWDESPEDLENSTEWIFQGYLIFGSDGWHTARTYEAEVLAVVEQQYVQHTLSISGRTRQGYFEIADSRLCTGKFRKPTTVEKRDRFS